MFVSPYPPYDPTDTNCFSYETVLKRWPIIITGIIDHLCQVNHELSIQAKSEGQTPDGRASIEDKMAEGTAIISKISKLKYEMARDRPLEPIPEDGEPFVELYNTELEKLNEKGTGTWFTAPWLYAECYLYRLLRSYFALTKTWTTYDPFFTQKQETFSHSGEATYKLATTLHDIEAEKDAFLSDTSKLGVLFKEMIQICLWGNATDLSLLTHLSPSEIQQLQSAQESRKDFILRDDADAVWKHIQTLKDGRVDWALDNSGYELFTDFVFADFLVTYTPYVSRVVFHPKLIPWFVSDVTPPDFSALVSALSNPSFFPPTSSPESVDHLKEMVARWQRYLSDGTFALSVPRETTLGAGGKENEGAVQKAGFWTMPWACWDMQAHAPELWEYFRDSGLVIFKGDLHYRKLVGDVRWPAGTPFKDALGPLAGAFPLLSLRTNKADVVVGVDQATADRLDASEVETEKRWRVNGKYALISFQPKEF